MAIRAVHPYRTYRYNGWLQGLLVPTVRANIDTDSPSITDTVK